MNHLIFKNTHLTIKKGFLPSLRRIPYDEIDRINSNSQKDGRIELTLNLITGKQLKLYLPSHEFSKAKERLDHIIYGDIGLTEKRQSLTDITSLVDKICSNPSLRINNLVDFILRQAVYHQASDIYLEEEERRLRVGYKIDGQIFGVILLPAALRERVVARIKVMCGAIIYRHDLVQEGRLIIETELEKVETRVSIIPTNNSERIAVRILAREGGLLTFDRLGHNQKIVEQLKEIILKPNGMLIVTGPSGSGKTTSIYSLLKIVSDLRGKTTNMVSIEDPIEYNLSLVNQIQVNKVKEQSLSGILAAVLRHDPDLIMVGEMRDYETTNLAFQASLTGQLIISTLHCGVAKEAFTRLKNIGIENYLLAHSIIGILSQRLVRKVCLRCKTEDTEVDPDLLNHLQQKGYEVGEDFYRGKGCEDCYNTGFKGRTAIAELLIPEKKIKDISKEFWFKMKIPQQIDILQDGLNKVRDGITSLSEVQRVLRIGDYL
ncbi:MAG: GspE/PulE family protein [bacterium]